MVYKNVLDGQVKSKANYPIPITLEPHLENRITEIYENNNSN